MSGVTVYTPQPLAPAVTSSGPTFYLGTHHPHWLRLQEFADVPLFISRDRLTGYKNLPRALGRWAMDSAGFSKVKKHGCWPDPPPVFVDDVRRIVDGVGRMPDFIAPQDWMCEPWVIEGKNWHLKPSDPKFFHGTREARGLGPTAVPGEDEQPFDDAVRFHQERTVENFLELRSLAPELPWIPVLQGWRLIHYQQCAYMYEDAGVHLASQPTVGLGSVCRRQSTSEIGDIVGAFSGPSAFSDTGLRLHGFGVKKDGLEKYRSGLTSADSMAWSYHYRKLRRPAFPGHGERHKNCANCPDAALEWRQQVLDVLDGVQVRQTVRKAAEPAA